MAWDNRSRQLGRPATLAQWASGSELNGALAGAIAGTLATLPMSLWMLGLARALPPKARYPLPPRRVAVRAALKPGLGGAVDRPEERTLLTALLHFGYGGAAGTLYGLLAERLPSPKPLSGVLFGLAVWAGSYLGWLPAVGLHPHAGREPASRNLLMISAHVVWGVALGGLQQLLASRDRTPSATRAPPPGVASDGCGGTTPIALAP